LNDGVMSKTKSDGPIREEFPISVASLPINARQRYAALTTILLMLVGAAVVAPYASVPLTRLNAFIPVLQTVICVADLVTAVLLFAQYAVRPVPALLVLASGYIASGMFAFLQTLAFPGAYAPAGAIGDGMNSPAWLFVLWHTTFPLSVLIYAVSKDMAAEPDRSGTSPAIDIGLTIACVLVVIAAMTWLVTSEAVTYLPSLYAQDVIQQTLLANRVNLVLWLWGLAALIALFIHRRTILDLWLLVTLVAWMPNFVVAAFTTSVRFSFGWYTARVYALLASCTVLVVLLTETTLLYSRLASAFVLLRRERSGRLMSVDAATGAIAHEIRQPLASIASSGRAALNFLKRAPPDLDEVRQALDRIVEQAHRADETIASVRELFKKRADQRTSIQVDDVIRQAMGLMEQDLLSNHISAVMESNDDLPRVHADRRLLQQVILNLIKNAIEAMQSVPAGARRLRFAIRRDGKSKIVLSVQDSGHGIAKENRERIFDPFFTTKHDGMGLGLAVCRTIVEEHGGDLRLAGSGPDGSTFEIALPIDGGNRGGLDRQERRLA
jgi:signal transduction histidine kinase